MIREFIQARGNRADFLRLLSASNAPVVRFRLLGKAFYLVNDRALISRILVQDADAYAKGVGLAHARDILGEGQLTSSGDRWRRQRDATRPIFSEDAIRAYSEVMAREWEGLAASHGELPADLSLKIFKTICSVLLGVDVSAELGRSLTGAMSAISRLAASSIAPPGSIIAAIDPVGRRRRREAVGLLHGFIERSVLEAGGRSDETPIACVLERLGGEPLHVRRDQVATILLAGYETTAAALFWTIYLLSRHPSVARAVTSEVRGLGKFRYEDVQALPLTRAVIAESLRLFPPVWVIPRRTLRRESLGGMSLPEGAEILISPYALHRDSGAWVDAQSFRPERFRGNERRGRFLPFGMGPRRCIGSRFAQVELVASLAAILDRFDLGSSQAVRPRALLTLCPPRSSGIVLSRV